MRPGVRRFEGAGGALGSTGRHREDDGAHGESRHCDRSLISLNEFLAKKQHHDRIQNGSDIARVSTHAHSGKVHDGTSTRTTNTHRNLPPRNLSNGSSHHSDPNHDKHQQSGMNPEMPFSLRDSKRTVQGRKGPQRSAHSRQRHDYHEEKVPALGHRKGSYRGGSETKAMHGPMTTGRKLSQEERAAPSRSGDGDSCFWDEDSFMIFEAPSFEDDSRRGKREDGTMPSLRRRSTLSGSMDNTDDKEKGPLRRVVTLDSNEWPSRRGRAHREAASMGNGHDQRVSQRRGRSRSAGPLAREKDKDASSSRGYMSPHGDANEKHRPRSTSPESNVQATNGSRPDKKTDYREEAKPHKPRLALDDLKKAALLAKSQSIRKAIADKIGSNPLLIDMFLVDSHEVGEGIQRGFAPGSPCSAKRLHAQKQQHLPDQRTSRDRRRHGHLGLVDGKQRLPKNPA
jgi:hypothetical protein